MNKINIAFFQMQANVGDLSNNAKKIMNFYNNNHNYDAVVTPELALSGYGCLDDIFAADFQAAIMLNINYLCEVTKGKKAILLLGTPFFASKIDHIAKDKISEEVLATNGYNKKTAEEDPYSKTIDNIFNTVLVIHNGKIINIIYKQKIPNYGVFNEYRYFKPKATKNIVEVNSVRLGIFICEDMWYEDKVIDVLNQNPDVLISINASPFEVEKAKKRLTQGETIVNLANKQCKKNIPFVYLNLVGGQDELVFDGASFVINHVVKEELQNAYMLFKVMEEDEFLLIVKESENKQNQKGFVFDNTKNVETPKLWHASREEKIYSCLIKGTRDFIHANGFKGIIIGLSGGIDSALTTAIAVDSLGSNNVMVVSMPSLYTSDVSKSIIEEIKNNLEISCYNVPIDGFLNSYQGQLEDVLSFKQNGVKENLQARIRANILMAFTNHFKGYMLFTTGNKSEIATGYSTIYGDSCGGFNAIKDLYKRDVVSLCKWRNENIPQTAKLQKKNILPKEVILRKPSAELKHGQFDEDSLMDYNTLDEIIFNIVEKNKSIIDLYAMFKKELVDKVINLIKTSHYKRHQSAMGIKISARSFGKDFMYPLSNQYKINNKYEN